MSYPIHRSVPLAVLLGAALVTSGCSAAREPVASTGSASPSASPSAPTSTPEEAADELLTVQSVATAGNGAQLDVTVRVRNGVPAGNGSDLDQVLLDQCGDGFLSAGRLTDEAWGLYRVDVSATQVGDAVWPADTPISLVTSGEEGSGQGALASSDALLGVPADPAGESGSCLVPRTIAAAGSAYFVLGIASDFRAEESPTGVMWNTNRFGLSTDVLGAPSDAELSECEVTKTPLGEDSPAPETSFVVTDDATACWGGVPYSGL